MTQLVPFFNETNATHLILWEHLHGCECCASRFRAVYYLHNEDISILGCHFFSNKTEEYMIFGQVSPLATLY